VKGDGFAFKRDSVLRMNLAKALEPYRHDAVLTQSPLSAGDSAYQNAATSALLHRETAVTAFQYPFALNLNETARIGQGFPGRSAAANQVTNRSTWTAFRSRSQVVSHRQ
jgi:CRISPR-associated protein Cst2